MSHTAAAQSWSRLRDAFWPAGLDFREHLVNAAGVVGVAICWATGVYSLVQGTNLATVMLNIAAGFATIGLLWFARVTGRYRVTYVITVVGLFMVLFPWFFFAGGGYVSGMPAFFVFAIVFSAFILEGWALWVLLPTEVAIFVACIIAADLNPAWVSQLSSSHAVAADVIYCVVASGLALTAALRLLIRIYEQNKAELVARNAQLAQVDQAKSELLAMVAHELNTPLMVIRAHAEEATGVLGEDQRSSRVGRDLQVIDTEADRLGRLVAQLLDLSRISDGRLVVATQPANLGALVQETLRSYRPVLTRSGNRLELERGSAAPVVLMDRERIVQVLVNLLSNAARHTQDGRIAVSVKVVGPQAEIAVIDTGEGIAAELIPQLGKAPLPVRRDGVRSARDTGLGVGLMISTHIIEAHGGELRLESTPGAGTTARFSLPLAPEVA